MARVLIPTRSMRYNPNPRGSATAVVTMRSNNPFERRTTVANGRMMPGLGALEVPTSLTNAIPASTVEAAKSSTGIPWGGIATNLLNTAIQVGGQVATNQLVKPVAQPLPSAGITTLPVVQPVIAYPQEARASKLPLILLGLGVVGLGAVLILRKKR